METGVEIHIGGSFEIYKLLSRALNHTVALRECVGTQKSPNGSWGIV